MITDDRMAEIVLANKYSSDPLAIYRAIEAEVHEELRKQEPVAWIHPLYKESGFKLVGITRWSDDCLPLYDWKAEYLRQVDLHNQTLDELREAEMQLRNPAPTPPTPFQQESVPKGFIVVSKDLLAEAIACNTDASLAEARHIINSVLKVSDDEIFREVLKEESK